MISNGPSLSSSSSHSTDESMQSKSSLIHQSRFFQRMISLGRLATQHQKPLVDNLLLHDQQFSCSIHFLDQTERTISIDRHAYGSTLLNKIFDSLDLNAEKEYFGLLIEDFTDDVVYHWLDPQKTLRKQFPNSQQSSIHLHFKVRFFPVDPSTELKSEFVKYLFVLQIKQEILTGKMSCPLNTAALLASYLVQGELGDFDPQQHRSGYLLDFRFVSVQTVDFEYEVEQYHKQHRGQSPAETEINYLRVSSSLPMYGIELHKVSVKVSHSTIELNLGICATGILVFQNSKKLNTFSWHRITKISFKRRTFRIQLAKETDSPEENSIVFTLHSYHCCKYLWKSCVDHHTFFRFSSVPLTETKEKVFQRVSNQRRIMTNGLSTLSTTSTYFHIPLQNTSIDKVIKLNADLNGRYGFNIKTGDNDPTSMIIGKVVFNTPASRASLHEGDQLLAVNQVDVRSYQLDEVIEMIRQSRERPQGELELWIKEIKSPLINSLELLREDLNNQRLIEQYNLIPRRNEDHTYQIAHLTENITFNRYRDVLPYDQTRVILRSAIKNDYINANHIQISIRSTEIVNRYIASQGPLPNTCEAFWRMIWEQDCSLILMLTPLIESSRVKCHQYWPNLFQHVTFGPLTIRCCRERQENDLIYRELFLFNEEINEERFIYQIQNEIWPDHGVPNDYKSFLDFLLEVRQLRKSKRNSPVLVHCSAGIGRTGVLILIETALCLIENSQAIFPLEIVRQMRDQRMGMIQTASQYQFACEAILYAYDHGLIDQ